MFISCEAMTQFSKLYIKEYLEIYILHQLLTPQCSELSYLLKTCNFIYFTNDKLITCVYKTFFQVNIRIAFINGYNYKSQTLRILKILSI